jgi:aryl-alcohol dehydrogenase-like predicted oxidoreductase
LGETDARSSRYPRFTGENFHKNLLFVDRLTAIANRKKVKPGQLALAWVLAKGRDIVPIPGTKRRTYLEENAASVAIQLTPNDVAELEAAVPEKNVAGDRYTAAGMKWIDR